MAAANTYKEQQDRVLDLISKSDSTTRNRVKNWINMGYYDFVLRELWPFREKTGTISLVQGTQEYDLVTNFADIDLQNIISVSIQGASSGKLIYWPFNQLRADQPDLDSQGQALPSRYYLKGGKIGFWPVPNGTDSVAVDYYLVPTELSADADEPVIPVGYRESLVQYALSKEHDFNSDPDLAIKASNEYEQFIIKARMNLLTQPTDSGSFRIMGPADYYNWTDI